MIQPEPITDEARRQDAVWRAARARMKAAEVSQRSDLVKPPPVVHVEITEAQPEAIDVSVNVSIPPTVFVSFKDSDRTAFAIKIDDIQRESSRLYGVSRVDLLSARRTANVVRPRQVAMYLAKTLTLRSLPEIGQKFGNRDHTTVLHAVRKIEALRKKNKQLDDEIEHLMAILRGE
jgi:Bacterial dnaA protein helix-turn-helix